MVAAPFWAAVHAIGSQEEGIATHQTMAGYMLVTTLIAYPMLAVIGLMLGFILIYWGSLFLFVAFGSFVEGMMVGSYLFIGSTVFFLVLFVVMLLGVANKSYTLCFELPASVLRWIGAGASSLMGEQTSAGEVKSMFLGFYASTKGLAPRPRPAGFLNKPGGKPGGTPGLTDNPGQTPGEGRRGK